MTSTEIRSLLSSVPSEQLMALQSELESKLERLDIRASFRQFIKRFSGEPEPAKHHDHLISKLQAVADGKIKRLMVFMPPGSAKSHYANVMFSAWFIGNHPGAKLITASFQSDVAEKWGRRVRAIVRQPEYKDIFDTELSQDSQAAGRWALTSDSEYYAVGVGGPITSFRADLAIIDDPVKGRAEADSLTVQDSTIAWYQADFWTRLKPEAAVVVIMTRWNERDLAGFLLDEAKTGGEQWDVVSFPMLAEENDALGREPGERLWPEWFTDDMVIQAQRNPRNWTSLYQQRPVPIGGGEFKNEWIQHYSPLDDHTGMNVYMLVDPATSKKDSADWTAICVVGLAADNNYYLLDLVRDRLNPTERIAKVMSLHKKWNALASKPPIVGYESYGMQSDGHYLKQAQNTANYRFPVVELKGNKLRKEDRIRMLVPLFQDKRVYLPLVHMYTNYANETRDIMADFISIEYENFPVAPHDDMLDALARICDPDLNANFPRIEPGTVIDINHPQYEQEDNWENW